MNIKCDFRKYLVPLCCAWLFGCLVGVAKIHASSKDPDYDCIIINPKTNIQIKHLLRYYTYQVYQTESRTKPTV